jgi:molybdopterin-guanine dinucleotide biosynthesis protein B
MKRVHIVGRKNHGKTTLVAELVTYLKQRGYRVGTIKHTHHHHELDTPGKDSHRHRLAGADVVGVLSPKMNALFWEPANADSPDRYAEFAARFSDCDLVVVEGDSRTTAAKVEVWRAEAGSDPMALQDDSILAVVTDDALDASVTTLSRSDIPDLAAWILRRLEVSAG